MSTTLHFLLGREHIRDLREAASRSRLLAERCTPVTSVTLRYSSAADAAGLRTLAALDSAPTPSGSLLVAVIDGRLQAALPLDGGTPIADPFQCSGELVDLLRLRAAQLGHA